MVKILELEHHVTQIDNLQSRVVEYESFEEYCKSLLIGEILPEHLHIYNKRIWNNKQELIFNFLNIKHPENQFVHYAKVIE